MWLDQLSGRGPRRVVRRALGVALVAQLAATGAVAEESHAPPQPAQVSRAQVWPGRVQLAAQTGFVGYFGNGTLGGTVGYAVMGDVSVRVADLRVGALWLGAGLNYVGLVGAAAYAPHDFQPWIFVTTTFEKRARIPIVPFLRAGLGGDVLDYSGIASMEGAFVFRVGGGFDYWPIRRLGFGLQNYLTVGPRFTRGVAVLYASSDLSFSLRVAF